MSDDLLNRATRALRDADEAPVMPSKHVILHRIEGERRTRARRLAVLVPLAAVVVTSTAIAAATGRLPVAWRAVQTWWQGEDGTAGALSVKRAETRPTAPGHGPGQAVPAAPMPEAQPASVGAVPTEHPDAPVGAPPSPSSGRPAVPAPSHKSTVGPQVAVAPVPEPAVAPPLARAQVPAAAPPVADGLEQFRAAQRLQFEQRQWPAALAAWDAYLQTVPHGALAPEARWNRALCLVRLERRAEARQALLPFASGAESGYRQAQALELLSALDQDAGDSSD